jgi:hypothetical protein
MAGKIENFLLERLLLAAEDAREDAQRRLDAAADAVGCGASSLFLSDRPALDARLTAPRSAPGVES